MNGERIVMTMISCAVCLSVLGGCQEPPVPGQAVSGVVRVEQSPLEHGLVTFIPLAGTKGPRVTAPVRVGKFTLPAESGPWPGSYRLEINATPPELIAMSKGKGVSSVSPEEHRAFREIHDDFSATSKLQIQVNADKPNHFEFDAKWAP